LTLKYLESASTSCYTSLNMPNTYTYAYMHEGATFAT
jgi:hypothetical protein